MRTIRDVYDQVIKRGHLLSHLQISQIDHVYNRISNLSSLKFLPQVIKDIKTALKEKTVNQLICEELGISKDESKFINYNADLERFTLNQDGIRYVI